MGGIITVASYRGKKKQVDGFSNPTDWSFDSLSSPGHGRPIKNTYDGTALGDKPDIKVRKVNVAAILHMKR